MLAISGATNEQSVPNTVPIRDNVNPATWMLEVIGAGTSGKVREVIHSSNHARKLPFGLIMTLEM